MTDEVNQSTIKLYELYDELAEDAGLLIPRPDPEEAQQYYDERQDQFAQVKAEIRKQHDAGVPDVMLWDSQNRIHLCKSHTKGRRQAQSQVC